MHVERESGVKCASFQSHVLRSDSRAAIVQVVLEHGAQTGRRTVGQQRASRGCGVPIQARVQSRSAPGLLDLAIRPVCQGSRLRTVSDDVVNLRGEKMR